MNTKTLITILLVVVVSVLGFAGGKVAGDVIYDKNYKKEYKAAMQKPAPQYVNVPFDTDGKTPLNPVDGIKYIDLKVGEGKEVKKGSKVKMNYTGTLISNDKEFDSSLKPGRTPFETVIGAGQLIKGWDLGVPGMKEGGKRELIINSAYGYGSRGAGSSIGPDEDLRFTVEVLEVLE
jgi:FKBP-type peptidyl-prolyl cis-trans isomerase